MDEVRSIQKRHGVPVEIAVACRTMQLKCVELKAEIRQLADEGKTSECDDRHDQIDTLESAMAILLREDD